jgi:hypothetical protein
MKIQRKSILCRLGKEKIQRLPANAIDVLIASRLSNIMGLMIADGFRFAESLGAAQAVFEVARIPRISVKKLLPQFRVKLLAVRAGMQKVLEASHRFLDVEDEHTEENLRQAFAILSVNQERIKVLFEKAKPITDGPLRRYLRDFPFGVWRDIKTINAQIAEVHEIIAESLSEEFSRELAEAKNAVELQTNN